MNNKDIIAPPTDHCMKMDSKFNCYLRKKHKQKFPMTYGMTLLHFKGLLFQRILKNKWTET